MVGRIGRLFGLGGGPKGAKVAGAKVQTTLPAGFSKMLGTLRGFSSTFTTPIKILRPDLGLRQFLAKKYAPDGKTDLLIISLTDNTHNKTYNLDLINGGLLVAETGKTKTLSPLVKDEADLYSKSLTAMAFCVQETPLNFTAAFDDGQKAALAALQGHLQALIGAAQKDLLLPNLLPIKHEADRFGYNISLEGDLIKINVFVDNWLNPYEVNLLNGGIPLRQESDVIILPDDTTGGYAEHMHRILGLLGDPTNEAGIHLKLIEFLKSDKLTDDQKIALKILRDLLGAFLKTPPKAQDR